MGYTKHEYWVQWQDGDEPAAMDARSLQNRILDEREYPRACCLVRRETGSHTVTFRPVDCLREFNIDRALADEAAELAQATPHWG